MRVGLIVDMTGVPAVRFRVIDTFYRDRAYRLVDLVYADLPLRDKIPDTPIRLPSNPLAAPDVGTTQRHDVSFGGGTIGRAHVCNPVTNAPPVCSLRLDK